MSAPCATSWPSTPGELACLMLTNPNTLGLFETDIVEVARLVHEAGGLLYYDGANSNAVLGRSRPGDMGFDIVHFNTHKTFSTPHGGGGPGAGPVVVREILEPYLPTPVLKKIGVHAYTLDYDRPKSIGKVRSFYGNFGVLVRAYAYIRALGADGLREVSDAAVLNATYVMAGIRDLFEVPYDGRSCTSSWCRPSPCGSTACGRSTSPSACSTTACTRRRPTSR